VIVNDRADIAKLSGAAGVHLGQDDLDPIAARRLLGGDAVIGISTHSADQVRAAATMAVDYIAVGPVFGTSTKDTGYRAVGTSLVSEATAILRDIDSKPVVAIGGITLERAPEVIRAGAASVAVISDLLSTGDPESRVREYLRALS
jgi:thiamine-phosphate pyrophosphorylase